MLTPEQKKQAVDAISRGGNLLATVHAASGASLLVQVRRIMTALAMDVQARLAELDEIEAGALRLDRQETT